MENDFITEDLFRWFQDEPDVLNNKKFKKLLKSYPKDVQDNIELYFMLHKLKLLTTKECNTIQNGKD